MKAVLAAFNQEKALVWTFSVITNLRMELFEALNRPVYPPPCCREKIAQWMETSLDDATDPWGVKVERVEM